MEQNSLLNLFYKSERLLARYQTLYHLAVRLCGPLDIKVLMKEVTNRLMESFDATRVYMYVFDDDETHAYPITDDAKSVRETILAQYGSNAKNLKEIVRSNSFLVVPIYETESDFPLAILVLIDEANQFDFETARKKLSIFSQIVRAATRRALIEEERKRISFRAMEAEAFGGLIGESQPMQEVKKWIQQVAQEDQITVLIQGKTGTGKEPVARAIHKNSKRKDKPFVAFNCGAFPEMLIESELFGTVPGAYTGAKDRPGLFEQANGGTIFLDEIGEMPPAQQVKLLRVLQEREIQRLGDIKTRKLDVRVIAATNKDLLHLVNLGTFRSDLYYRLHVFPIKLPKLCERGKDVLLLAQHFLEEHAAGDRYFTKEAKNALIQYMWPGNVRELENAVVHAIAVSTKAITPNHLPIEVTQLQIASSTRVESLKPSDIAIEPLVRQLVHTIAHAIHHEVRLTKAEKPLEALCANKRFTDAISSCNLEVARKELERFLIEMVWNDWRHNQTEAAEILGISRTQLINRLKSYEQEASEAEYRETATSEDIEGGIESIQG